MTDVIARKLRHAATLLAKARRRNHHLAVHHAWLAHSMLAALLAGRGNDPTDADKHLELAEHQLTQI